MKCIFHSFIIFVAKQMVLFDEYYQLLPCSVLVTGFAAVVNFLFVSRDHEHRRRVVSGLVAAVLLSLDLAADHLRLALVLVVLVLWNRRSLFGVVGAVCALHLLLQESVVVGQFVIGVVACHALWSASSLMLFSLFVVLSASRFGSSESAFWWMMVGWLSCSTLVRRLWLRLALAGTFSAVAIAWSGSLSWLPAQGRMAPGWMALVVLGPLATESPLVLAFAIVSHVGSLFFVEVQELALSSVSGVVAVASTHIFFSLEGKQQQRGMGKKIDPQQQTFWSRVVVGLVVLVCLVVVLHTAWRSVKWKSVPGEADMERLAACQWISLNSPLDAVFVSDLNQLQACSNRTVLNRAACDAILKRGTAVHALAESHGATWLAVMRHPFGKEHDPDGFQLEFATNSISVYSLHDKLL